MLILRTGLFKHEFEYSQIRDCYLLTERRPNSAAERNIRVGLSAAAAAAFWFLSDTEPADMRIYSALSFSLFTYFGSKPLYERGLRIIPHREKLPLQNIHEIGK